MSALANMAGYLLIGLVLMHLGDTFYEDSRGRKVPLMIAAIVSYLGMIGAVGIAIVIGVTA